VSAQANGHGLLTLFSLPGEQFHRFYHYREIANMRATLPLPGDPASPPDDQDAIAPDSGYATKRYRNWHERPFPHVRAGVMGQQASRLSDPLDWSCGRSRRRSPVPVPGPLHGRSDPTPQGRNCAAARESTYQLVITSQFLVTPPPTQPDRHPVGQCRLPPEESRSHGRRIASCRRLPYPRIMGYGLVPDRGSRDYRAAAAA